MSNPTRHRHLMVPFNGPKLVLCIALGLWVGFVAIGLTAWLVYRSITPQPLPLPEAAGQILRPAPPAEVYMPAPGTPAPQVRPAPGTSPEQNTMFDQYQQNLRNQEARQADDEARSNPRNLSNGKCQFWLQQNQTAPSEKSRANVAQFCD